MADLDPTVERVDGADGMVELWSPRTGRGATLSDDALRNLGRLPAVQRRLERLGMLADSALASFIPCRHHRTLLVLDPPTLMLPCPDRHGPGGYAYRAQPLSERDLALWRALDGRTLAATWAGRLSARA